MRLKPKACQIYEGAQRYCPKGKLSEWRTQNYKVQEWSLQQSSCSSLFFYLRRGSQFRIRSPFLIRRVSSTTVLNTAYAHSSAKVFFTCQCSGLEGQGQWEGLYPSCVHLFLPLLLALDHTWTVFSAPGLTLSSSDLNAALRQGPSLELPLALSLFPLREQHSTI